MCTSVKQHVNLLAVPKVGKDLSVVYGVTVEKELVHFR